MKYIGKSISELHELLINKEVTPLELTKEVISYCKKDTNNAFEYILEKEAIEFAKTLVNPEVDNLLWGIPFAAKDNFSTKDIPTCASSDILKGYVPLFNATVIQKLIDKKAVLVAKTTLDEHSMGGTGTTGHLGKTYNPYDKSHTRQTGGSSCGSAAVTASGIVPFALGSDTGDSIRKPASYTGLVGFKATWSRISRYGMFPFAPSLDHVGYFTRNVFDSALILNALAGRDDKDLTSSNLEVMDYTKDINKGVKDFKFVVIKEIIDNVKNKKIKNEFTNVIEKLKSKGATVTYKSLSLDLLRTIYPTYIIISCSEATSNNANLDGIKFGPYYECNSYEELLMKTRTKNISNPIKQRFVIGSFSLMKENQEELFLKAKKMRRLIVNTISDLLKDYDAMILPASPTIANKFDYKFDKLSDEYLISDNHLAIGNLTGYPSITLPIGFDLNMPFGINITSKAFTENLLFRISYEVEKITGLKDIYANKEK